MAILALRGLVAERALGPLADQLAGLEVVGGEQRVGGVDRIERRVERDDEDAGVARLLHRRHDRRRIARHQQDALGAGGDQLLDRRDLAVVVAVELAGVGLRGEAEFLGFGLEAFLHLDEERIGVGLGDEADDVACVGRRGDGDARGPQRRRSSEVRLFSTYDSSLNSGSAAFPASHARSVEATKRLLFANPLRAVAAIRGAPDARSQG